MSMVINTNVASLASQRHLASSRAEMEQAMERLSSGKRINSAMDDAAGLTIAHSLDSKIAGLNQAVRNANDGIALVNLAEGAMEEVSSMLTRMKELATQAINGTYTDTDRDAIDAEYQALADEITRISDNTEFNGVSVIGASSGTTVDFQLGDTSTDKITVTLDNIDAKELFLDSTIAGSANTHAAGSATAGSDLQTASHAAESLVKIDNAIATVDSYRSTLGAVANRMEHAASNLMSRVEHQTAARSRIQDADYAVESANLAKAQVLQQAGTAMLSQANASTQNVLSLLK
jgi:flagellin